MREEVGNIVDLNGSASVGSFPTRCKGSLSSSRSGNTAASSRLCRSRGYRANGGQTAPSIDGPCYPALPSLPTSLWSREIFRTELTVPPSGVYWHMSVEAGLNLTSVFQGLWTGGPGTDCAGVERVDRNGEHWKDHTQRA
ncbi:uncharacterized protein LOC135168879 isoform X2 [Diachasmimorpha longicaudata]|uniref:uncharacterized protein LOC135168879 isoform X2 n=1 Tax=Diachasmimorpha longicaudata TaxID=58733 RepID=UPI0030B873C4